jgi:hypothetical protein
LRAVSYEVSGLGNSSVVEYLPSLACACPRFDSQYDKKVKKYLVFLSPPLFHSHLTALLLCMKLSPEAGELLEIQNCQLNKFFFGGCDMKDSTRFELRALHLLCRYSTTGTTLPALNKPNTHTKKDSRYMLL